MAIRKKIPVRWNLRASDDLQTIYNKIKNRSPQNAVSVTNAILTLANSLGSFPEKFPRLLPDETSRNLRSVSKWSYRIIYEVTEDSVRAMKIFDNSEDPNKLLKGL